MHPNWLLCLLLLALTLGQDGKIFIKSHLLHGFILSKIFKALLYWGYSCSWVISKSKEERIKNIWRVLFLLTAVLLHIIKNTSFSFQWRKSRPLKHAHFLNSSAQNHFHLNVTFFILVTKALLVPSGGGKCYLNGDQWPTIYLWWWCLTKSFFISVTWSFSDMVM